MYFVQVYQAGEHARWWVDRRTGKYDQVKPKHVTGRATVGTNHGVDVSKYRRERQTENA